MRGAARMSWGRRSVTTGSLGTRVQGRDQPTEAGPLYKEWLGWTDRLLHPQHLCIWGRRGEDWRLGDVDGWSSEVEGAVALTLERIEGGHMGVAHVLPASGTVMLLHLPGHVTWQIDRLDDNPNVAKWPSRRWFSSCVPEEWL